MSRLAVLKPLRGDLSNFVLQEGELGFDANTRKIYIGDGVHNTRNLLPFGGDIQSGYKYEWVEIINSLPTSAASGTTIATFEATCGDYVGFELYSRDASCNFSKYIPKYMMDDFISDVKTTGSGCIAIDHMGNGMVALEAASSKVYCTDGLAVYGLSEEENTVGGIKYEKTLLKTINNSTGASSTEISNWNSNYVSYVVDVTLANNGGTTFFISKEQMGYALATTGSNIYYVGPRFASNDAALIYTSSSLKTNITGSTAYLYGITETEVATSLDSLNLDFGEA